MPRRVDLDKAEVMVKDPDGSWRTIETYWGSLCEAQAHGHVVREQRHMPRGSENTVKSVWSPGPNL